MRPLSRLLSVFIALILMGLSFLTASAHEATGNVGKNIIRVTVERTDDKEMVYPGEELEFTVIVELLLDHTIGGSAADDGGILYGPDYDSADTAANRDKEDVDLSSTVSYIAFEEVKYKVRSVDLGAAQSRTATLTWTFTFDADTGLTNAHATQTATGSVDVDVMKRPAAEGGVAQLELDFGASTAPTGDDIARGAEVTFKLTAKTGDYKIAAKSLVIKKQLYDADDTKVGNLVSVASIAIPELDSNSESASLESGPKTYKLLQSEVDEIEDGGRLEFSYSHTITENEVYKAGTDISAVTDQTGTEDDPIPLAGDRIDLNSDDDHGTYGANAAGNTYDSVKLEGTIITVEMDAPEPEATPDPNIIGSNEAATVTLGADGNTIEVMPADGTPAFTLFVGRLYTDGSASYRSNGYIRQADAGDGRGFGQTYGIVKRDHDGEIVRKWISSTDSVVTSGSVPWDVIEMNYTYPRDVISAIPLDDMYPAPDQLVRNDDNHKIYVYRAGAWRHVPDLATFKDQGFYWCDVTSADATFFERFTEGGALVPSGTPDIPNYPTCHNE